MVEHRPDVVENDLGFVGDVDEERFSLVVPDVLSTSVDELEFVVHLFEQLSGLIEIESVGETLLNGGLPIFRILVSVVVYQLLDRFVVVLTQLCQFELALVKSNQSRFDRQRRSQKLFSREQRRVQHE